MPAVFLASLVAVIPHIIVQSLWMQAAFTLSWGGAFLVQTSRIPFPKKTVRHSITIFCAVGLFIIYGGVFKNETGIGLLIIMAGLKLLETSTHRDKVIVVLVSYFMATTSLFISDSLVMTLYMGLSTLTSTSVLIHLNSGVNEWRANLKTALVIMAQSLPLFLVLFFFFPRLHDNFWGLLKSTTASTGLTDELRPGSIAKLAQNKKVVFRVSFNDRMPAVENLYWRALVLYEFDGQAWQIGSRKWYFPDKLKEPNNPVTYDLTVEPHGKRWLFALDVPTKSDIYGMISADYTLRSFVHINKRKSYRTTSYQEYITEINDFQLSKAISLPDGGNEKARMLAADWAALAENTEQLVAIAKQYFIENNFKYTFTPPLLGRERIDDFLFGSMKGYCEHFASAFAFLMRAAGVPSRIVVGYLGGEYNHYGDYLIVRQSDAHAWVEVFMAEKGWVRVDPTGLIFPERIGNASFYGQDQYQSTAEFLVPQSRRIMKWMRPLMLRWDHANNIWYKWIMGYTGSFQGNLLDALGLKARSLSGRLKWLIVIILAVSLCVIMSYVLLSKLLNKPEDKVAAIYRLFCEKLARAGIERHKACGPCAFCEKVVKLRPDIGDEVRKITRIYIQLRYRKGNERLPLADLQKRVKDFRP